MTIWRARLQAPVVARLLPQHDCCLRASEPIWLSSTVGRACPARGVTYAASRKPLAFTATSVLCLLYARPGRVRYLRSKRQQLAALTHMGDMQRGLIDAVRNAGSAPACLVPIHRVPKCITECPCAHGTLWYGWVPLPGVGPPRPLLHTHTARSVLAVWSREPCVE